MITVFALHRPRNLCLCRASRSCPLTLPFCSPPLNQNNRPFCHCMLPKPPPQKKAAPNANAHAYPSLCVCSLASNPSCILSLPFWAAFPPPSNHAAYVRYLYFFLSLVHIYYRAPAPAISSLLIPDRSHMPLKIPPWSYKRSGESSSAICPASMTQMRS